ncbi:MAG: hypothetical protein ABJ308_09670 [Halieaceae bacterium]
MRRLLIAVATCLLSVTTLAAEKDLVCTFERHHMFINRPDTGAPIQTETRMILSVERGGEYVVRINGMRMEQVRVADGGNTITFVKPGEVLHDAEGWDKPRVPGMNYSVGIAPSTSDSAIMTGMNSSFATVSIAACSEEE